MKKGRLIALGAAVLVASSCGTRTGLLGDGVQEDDASFDDSGAPFDDAAADVARGPDGAPLPPDAAIPEASPFPDGCGDTHANPAHCGACGHDCGGAACVEGVCQPMMIAGDERFPSSLVVDDQNVYWTNVTNIDYGQPPASILVRSMPKVGGTAKTLETILTGYATSLHRDGPYLYFYRSVEWRVSSEPYQGTVVRLCADGSCPHKDLSGSVDNRKWEIALDSTRIFFPTSYSGGMSQIPKAGGAPTAMGRMPGFLLTRFAIDDTYVYAIAVPNDTLGANQPVMLIRSKKDPSAVPEPIYKGLVEGGDVWVDRENIYVSNLKAILKMPKNGPFVPTTLATGKPGLMTLDGKRIYWLEYASPTDGTKASLHWVGTDGTGVGSMTLEDSATFGPGIAFDDKSLFWVTTIAPIQPPIPPRGGIMRLTKPL